jgi:hypothetical protein
MTPAQLQLNHPPQPVTQFFLLQVLSPSDFISQRPVEKAMLVVQQVWHIFPSPFTGEAPMDKNSINKMAESSVDRFMTDFLGIKAPLLFRGSRWRNILEG